MSKVAVQQEEYTPTVCIVCGEQGGRFRLRGDGWVHVPRCSGADKSRDGAKNLWDFTTTNLGPDPNFPIHITSREQLSRLEGEFGVSNRALNYNQQNWED